MPHPNQITGWLPDPPRREFRHRFVVDHGANAIAAHIDEEGGIHVWLDVATAKHAGSWVRVDTKAEADALLARLYPVPVVAEEDPDPIVRALERARKALLAIRAANAEYAAARAELTPRWADDDTNDDE